MIRFMVRAAVFSLSLLAFSATDVAAQKMYFTGNGSGSDTVRSANLDGSGIQVLVSGLSSPQDVDVDIPAGKVYWTNSGTIRRANLNGTSPETVITGVSGVRGVAVDPAGGKLYWTLPGKIERANLNGTGMETIVSGLNAPVDVAVDSGIGQVFWIDVNNSLIQRANLDGTNVQTVTSVNGWTLGLDRINQIVYWATTQQIGKVDYSGSNKSTILSGFTWADGIAIDVKGGKMYWADRIADTISRADLDGNNVQVLISAGLDTILGIALDVPQDPCAGSIASYGQGCAGAGGFIPELSVSGCPIPGSQITLEITKGLGGSSALLLFGLGQGSLPIGLSGCTLLLSPLFGPVLTLPLGGAGAGTGSVNVAGTLPAGTSGATFTIQAWIIDPASAADAAGTNGVQVTIG